ncbi:glycosyltransferase family 2 protein [Streptomyces sp. AC495_CC817]|uniref:glycosyltransferase family 2 protein n=1 Tax=Streptomyces sp. AC495_CC817 TaxID=2823900 RepID=UPI001C255FFF|nr:glycosyltransferase family 2 protein [Streptomyces sp. AC495_CC817]
MNLVEWFFHGIPAWAQVLFWIALVLSILNLVSVVTLVVAAGRARRRDRRRDGRLREAGDLGREDGLLWVFLVPALNEEVTIADSVSRLQQVRATNAVFLVIDDGSDDRTGEILATIDDPRLHVLTRVAPEARVGKAAALNAAFAHLRDALLAEPRFARWTPETTVCAIVDADGRLDPDAPEAVARQLSDPRVGGVQLLVRIYNRRSPLTWAQDVEFSSFGRVFQAGRSWWGTANMGGNGQFNRMAALASIDDGSGPWRDRLTEDQDLGVRLIQQGWAGAQENGTAIDQQGLNSLRRLYRQRVRWAQGNWQAMTLLRGVGRPRVPLLGRIDSVFYLFTPALQLLIGVAFIASIFFWALRGVPYEPTIWWVLLFFVGVSFGPGLVALVLRGNRWYTPLLALLQIIPYTIYSWIVFPVLAVSLVRQLAGRTTWAKTARESIDDEDAEYPRSDSNRH